jgi:TonB family protein
MKRVRVLFVIVFVFTQMFVYAQTSTTKYYKDKYLDKEVPEAKANFSQTIIRTEDGKITIEKRDLKRNKLVWRETNRGEEQFGIWINETPKGYEELDFNFDLNYKDTFCEGIALNKPFENNDTIGYKAPQLPMDNESVFRFIAREVQYPVYAKENGIMGRVVLTFNINKEGIIENIAVKKSAHVSLDKEAVRVIKKLKFKSPPMLNGENAVFCVTFPIIFELS